MSNRKLILSMQITLDGYVAGKNDEADWLINSHEEWEDLFDDLKDTDTFLLGRKMYPFYSGYWQSVLHKADADPNELRFARMAAASEHIVFTRGSFSPDWKNARVSNDLAGEVTRLKNEPGKNLMAWGGADFARSLIALDLVDEYRFAINPTILGDGKKLFENINQQKKLSFISSKPMDDQLVVVRYGK